MDLTSGQVDFIREWNERLSKPISIRLLKAADERTGLFEKFGGMLSQLALKVRFITEKGEGAEPPALSLGNAWRYHLVPTGAELKPFLELAAMIAQDACDLPEFDTSTLKAVQWPSRIKIYVTNYCPHCKEVVTRITPLPLFNPLIHIMVIDGTLFPELAAADKVRSVPTVICDDRFRWTGPVRPDELIGVLAERDPSQLSMETFKRMIQEKETDRLAGMMMESNRIYPGFLETLMHSEFGTRLGAMVVFEDIAERMPELAQKAFEPIWEKMGTVDENVKGDMIYFLGKAGGPEWIPRLEAFNSQQFSEEFRKIVEEALEGLRRKKLNHGPIP